MESPTTGPRKVVGSKAFEQPEQIRKKLCSQIHLAIDFEEVADPDCAPGSRVLIFQVPSRPLGMPVKYDGRYLMRQEDSLVEMSESRLRSIFAESGQDFSAEVCPGLTMAHLDANAVEDFRRRWCTKAEKAADTPLVDRLQSLSAAQLLADAEAIVNGQMTYAALILFGRREAVGRHLGPAEVVFEYRSSDASGPAQERKEFRQGFFSYYDELWKLINLRNDKQDFREGLFVDPIATFNERPVREAILNAVSHRNYQLAGSIFIRQFPRRLEVDSPGGLPVGITLENILDRQNPRNRRLAEILTRCGLVERSGQGVNLMYEELIKQSKAAPDYSRTDHYQVGLTLDGTIHDPAFVRFVESVSRETTAFFSAHDWLLMAAASRGEQLPKESKKRVSRLVELGVIEHGSSGAPLLARRFYELAGRPGDYTRKKGLDREQNLALLKRHIDSKAAGGSKLDELCQVVPALGRTRVQSLLQTLKRRGLAHPVGQRRAGVWFPGPPRDDHA